MTDDYKRGRAAVAGRRPLRPPLRHRPRARLAVWLVGATAVLLLALVVVASPQRPSNQPASDHRVGTPGEAGVPVPSQSAVLNPESRVLQARETRYATWGEAAAAAVFPLRQPRWLPDGYWLSALQSFVPDIGDSEDLPVDSMTATYTGPEYVGPGSDHFVFHQFWVALPEEFDIRSTLPHPGIVETVHVGDVEALWQTGRHDSNIVLVWQAGRWHIASTEKA